MLNINEKGCKWCANHANMAIKQLPLLFISLDEIQVSKHDKDQVYKLL